MGRKGKGFFDDLKSGVNGSVKKFGSIGRSYGGAIFTPGGSKRGAGKMGGAWYNNWNDFKNGAKNTYNKLKPVHDFIRKHKLVSKAASMLGKDDFAKSADSYGYGIKKRRCKRC